MLPLMKPAALSKYGCLVATDGRGRSAIFMREVCLLVGQVRRKTSAILLFSAILLIGTRFAPLVNK